ncbi:ABC transporter substrate-binding protein, partial [Vibrio sp. FNV 38]|nr:ABC transporter substrate-binding protein [Vibrio sp. FNV 38]
LEYLSDSKMLESIDIAFGYGGDSFVLNEYTEGAPWRYSIPEEGTTLWLECLAVVEKKQLNPDAFTFITYLSSPDIAAQNAYDAWFATPVLQARELAPQDYSQNTELFPEKYILDKSHVYKRMSEDSLRIRNRMTESLRK